MQIVQISRLVAAVTMVACFSTAAVAEPRYDHYKGEPAETLDQALQNLSSYSRELDRLVSQDSIKPEDMHEIHELTYTLENALKRVDAEVAEMARELEEVHLGSEQQNQETVRTNGRAYLKRVAPLHLQ